MSDLKQQQLQPSANSLFRIVPRIPTNACDLVYLVQNEIITIAEARKLLGFTE